MSELFEKSIRVLELPRLLEMLEHHAVSAEAKARARRLTPSDDFGEVNRLLDETDAARKMIMLRGSPAFGGVRDVGEALSRAERGGMLNTRELLDIAGLLTNVRRVQDYYKEDEEGTVIDKLFLSLHPNRFLEEKIKRAIPDEDTIADAASTELADIRRHMRAAQAKSRQILQKIISSPSYGKILQETIITQRDGRFVVPVKAEHKGDLPGLVHDISSTGATLFVEPMGVVQANNEYIELQAKEQKEIDRILAEFSAEAAAHREDIQWDYDTLVHLDLIFARGQLSYKMNAVRPEVRRDGAIHLRKARHPLLDPKTAVPIDIELGDTFDTLVITGPNTGGKTVTLKTLGLLTLMTQCGLHIPAADRSAVSVYERVLADIGDEQSIEQSLSTFSAHMVNIVEILKEADRHSLVLFDELGAGTDPVEGAALAIAVIQHVRRLGAKGAATTHYAELKTFAMTTAGVENASCEFDVETLAPTYRLLIGIPGKSNAFAIPERLGLPQEIINDARSRVSTESASMEATIEKLEQVRQLMERDRAEAARQLREAEENRRKSERLKVELSVRLEKADEKARRDAERIIGDARRTADEVMRELDALRKMEKTDADHHRANDARAALRRKLNGAEDAAAAAAHPQPREKKVSARPVRVGDTVQLRKMGDIKATVTAISADRTLTLRAGIMNVTAKEQDVYLLENEKPEAQKFAAAHAASLRNVAAESEIDLRGMDTMEAVAATERFLDNAVMAKLEKVTIIHGKGTGALRAAVQQSLRKNKAVKSYRLGRYGEGESGVTVVELK